MLSSCIMLLNSVVVFMYIFFMIKKIFIFIKNKKINSISCCGVKKWFKLDNCCYSWWFWVIIEYKGSLDFIIFFFIMIVFLEILIGILYVNFF